MSIKEVIYYQVVCDAPDCGFATSDLGHEFSAWSDQDGALADWDCSDRQATAEGKHFCDDHRIPVCADCDKTEGLTQDADEEWWCPEHLETQPEHEAPAGVVA